jgi:hypothetical protein
LHISWAGSSSPASPLQGIQTQNGTPLPAPSLAHAGSLMIGIIMSVFGLHFLLRNVPFFHPYYWWFWDMGWHFFWPSILILVGLLVIFQGARK